MADRQQARQVFTGVPGCALLAASLVGLSGAEAVALPRVAPAHPAALGLVLIQDAHPGAPQTATGGGAGDQRAPFVELNEALAAARARLEELSRAAAAAAAAGQARQEFETIKEENQRLRAELASVRASRDQLSAASQNSAARYAELAKAAEDATAEAERIEEELVKVRWQNAQLNTSLAQAGAAQKQAEDEARAAQAALSTKVETLSASAERSAAEIARLRQELEDAQQQVERAAGSEERLAEMQDNLQGAEARSRSLDEQLAALRGQLDEVANERDRALQQVVEVADEAERLRVELASANNELGRMAASRGELEREVDLMRAAANSAADAARQNLLAVEARIREFNTALAALEPAAGDQASAPGAGVVPASDATPGANDDAAATAADARASTAPDAAVAKVAAERETPLESDLELIKSANAAEGGPTDEALRRLTPDNLPLEMRLQVQGLLVDLGAKPDSRGLKMTVPGASLFAINSETIEPTAYDTLAKVAELIDAYRDHEVMIVGHTDSIGDEAYNQTLSQRRAELVKQFFVDNFDLKAARLSIDGRGEAQPIATNATVSGRQANRRVEVLILD